MTKYLPVLDEDTVDVCSDASLTNQIITKIGTNKILITATKSSTIQARVASISGADITYGDWIEVKNSVSATTYTVAYHEALDRIAFCWEVGVSEQDIYCRLASISDVTLTLGVATNLVNDTDASSIMACYDPDTEQICVAHSYGSGGRAYIITIDNLTPTIGTYFTMTAGSMGQIAYNTDEDCLVFTGATKWHTATVSGTTISSQASGDINVATTTTNVKTVYDPVEKKIFRLGDNSSSHYIYTSYGTFSGYTITWSVPVLIGIYSNEDRGFVRDSVTGEVCFTRGQIVGSLDENGLLETMGNSLSATIFIKDMVFYDDKKFVTLGTTKMCLGTLEKVGESGTMIVGTI